MQVQGRQYFECTVCKKAKIEVNTEMLKFKDLTQKITHMQYSNHGKHLFDKDA